MLDPQKISGLYKRAYLRIEDTSPQIVDKYDSGLIREKNNLPKQFKTILQKEISKKLIKTNE